MKKLLLASAVAALSISAAQAAPTVYGRAFLTLDSQNGDRGSSVRDSRPQLNSNASRIGFRGSEALTANTDLVYQLEYGVDIDDATSTNQFSPRSTYLGLSNKQYGTVLAGRLSGLQTQVDYANVTQGGVLGGDAVLATFDGDNASPIGSRFNNAIAYVSPNYSGATFMGAYAMAESRGANNDGFQVGARYEQDALRAGVVYTQANRALKATRVSGAYDLSPAVTVGALYQLTDFNATNNNEHAFAVSGRLQTATPWAVYGQVDTVSNRRGFKDVNRQRLVVGGEYSFNQNTTGHVYGAYQKDKIGTTFNSYGVGAGLEYRF